MGWGEILGVAVALGCDATALGLSLGLLCHRFGQMAKLSLSFGLFQFIMPVIGWYFGAILTDLMSQWGPWLAFIMLAFLGLKMIHDAVRNNDETPPQDPSRWGTLLLLSLAVSIDALGVGLSMGVLHISLWGPALVIGLVATVMTFGALLAGRRLSMRYGARYGKRMCIFGGVVLILIGLKIVLGY